jgi:hypothetical protein
MEQVDLTEHVATALVAVPQLSKELLQSLACLGGCSKRLQTSVCSIIVREGLGLLYSALDAAHQNEQEHKQVVWWIAAALLREAPETAAGVTQRLISTPNMPLEAAKRLVAAGMRVSYAQLLAASNSMLAGVEVWVQAQQQLSIESDIPAIAVTICCGQPWVSCAAQACLGWGNLSCELRGQRCSQSFGP